MDPLCTEISKIDENVQIKEEIQSSEDEECENVCISRSTEIFVDEQRDANKSYSILENHLKNTSCTYYTDPLSEAITVDEIEIKQEVKWECSEIDIVDIQLDETESPFKEDEFGWFHSDETSQIQNTTLIGNQEETRRQE
uniref:Uncharacterized protein n=1 Tax=Graphocephala atropunctata TaxID=36148 RepID=A0A1B6MK06_9HEMI